MAPPRSLPELRRGDGSTVTLHTAADLCDATAGAVVRQRIEKHQWKVPYRWAVRIFPEADRECELVCCGEHLVGGAGVMLAITCKCRPVTPLGALVPAKTMHALPRVATMVRWRTSV
ncbi:hypothetical protein HRbin30_02137 [bacterium HR30]|nr:hypothetical protein HRbin30_02137 [bacterium HR30]